MVDQVIPDSPVRLVAVSAHLRFSPSPGLPFLAKPEAGGKDSLLDPMGIAQGELLDKTEISGY
jgi:hypothetical protein